MPEGIESDSSKHLAYISRVRCCDGSRVARSAATAAARVCLGPSGTRRVKGGVSGPAEDLRPVSEVEAGVNFRLAGGVRGRLQVSQEATRHRYQACQGRCGHTFPPPGGSWYAIRVTWTRIGHQAIDGLDEGVWNRMIGDLGANG